jgi:hypothetical protein
MRLRLLSPFAWGANTNAAHGYEQTRETTMAAFSLRAGRRGWAKLHEMLKKTPQEGGAVKW